MDYESGIVAMVDGPAEKSDRNCLAINVSKAGLNR
jgi:hypothetical protein